MFCAADVILSSFTLLTYWIHFLMLNYSAQAPHGLNMSYKARQDRSFEKEKDSSNPPLRIVVEKVIFVSTAWKGSKYRIFSSPYFPVFDQKKLRIWTIFTKCRMILRVFHLNFFAIENKDKWLAYIFSLKPLSKCYVTAQSKKYCSGEYTNSLL